MLSQEKEQLLCQGDQMQLSFLEEVLTAGLLTWRSLAIRTREVCKET